eukprot:TRINITY_DN88114_c0_g1_i1.p1 TRINITY_DN88114_c0_g1~~TRINITY_DN88114_c0_g1_i1.p1  ORF type:complete len:526 (+),score=61.93 TRINITY_DN88114_c0_g1_i1:82-1659(+)
MQETAKMSKRPRQPKEEEVEESCNSSKKARPLSALQLNKLDPQLMYGAMFSITMASLKAFGLIVGRVITSWRLIIAVSLAYILLLRFAPWATLAAHAGSLLLYAFAEACFFVRTHRIRQRLECIRPLEQRPLPLNGPLDIFRRTMGTVEQCAAFSKDTARSAEEWLQLWFLGAQVDDIYRDNLREEFAWAFFTRMLEEMDIADQQLLESMVDECERQFGFNFKPGYNPAVRGIRINFDPLNVWSHPLSYYASIRALSTGSRQYMRFLGFSYHPGRYEGVPFYHVGAPCHPGQLIKDGVAVSRSKRPPVVFIHGLGPGLAPYLFFIRRLASTHECFVLELPEISQVGVETAPTPQGLADALADMLASHGHKDACFIAHSYGTVELSWVLRHRPEIVRKAIFLDPVCFLLSQPDVAFNVLYRKPHNWFMTLVGNTVAWELYTANTLKRHFMWYNNVCWLDELPEQVVVALSSHDDICDSHMVRDYLKEHQRNGKRSQDELDLLWFDGFLHGEFLLYKSAQLQIMELI